MTIATASLNMKVGLGKSRRSISLVLLCALCLVVYGAASSAPKKKTEKSRVYLVHADELFFDIWKNNNARDEAIKIVANIIKPLENKGFLNLNIL